MITKDNYEIYFMDYLDGRLPESAQGEFKAFLLVNPDLAEFLEDMECVRLTPPSVIFDKKESLKKDLCHECPDYMAIAASEGVLAQEEKEASGKWQEQGTIKELIATYDKIRMIPDQNIRFPHKEKLYKPAPSRRLYIRFAAVAAVMALLFFTATNLTRHSKPETTIISENPILTEPIAASSLPMQPLQNIPLRLLQKTSMPQRAIIPARIIIEPIELTPKIGLIAATSEISAPQPDEILEVSVSADVDLILNESAKQWKSSTSSFESKDIFTSVINAGRSLAETLKIEQ